MSPLRPYQSAAVAGVLERDAAGRNPLLIAPTGSGKTRMLSAIINTWHSRGLTTLALAHRRELIQQMQKEFGHAAKVSTWQSMARRAAPYVDRCVIDEAHHVAEGTGYAKLIAELRIVNPRLQVVGATATPWRLDGKGLTADGLFDDAVIATTPAELLSSGVLVPYKGFAYRSVDTAGVKKVAGDFAQGALGEAARQPKLLGSIVERWKATASNLSTLVFAVNVMHAQALQAEFTAQGVHAEYLTGQDADSRRDRLFRDLSDRRLPVLINIAIATEGVDIPSLECLVLARPTLSECLALQMLGRVLRSSPGKTHARIHDHAQILETHGSPFAERDWSPRPERKRGPTEGGGSQQICTECLALISANCRVCPECGHVLREGKAVEPGDGFEVEISSEATPVSKVWEPKSVGDSIEGVWDGQCLLVCPEFTSPLSMATSGPHIEMRRIPAPVGMDACNEFRPPVYMSPDVSVSEPIQPNRDVLANSGPPIDMGSETKPVPVSMDVLRVSVPTYVDLITKLKRVPPMRRIHVTYRGVVRTPKGFLMRRFDVSTQRTTSKTPPPGLTARELELLNG